MKLSILSIICILCLIIGTMTPNWSIFKVGSVTQTKGLWKRCNSVVNSCQPTRSSNLLLIAKISMILSCVLVIVAILDTFILKHKDKKLQVGLFGVAGLLSLFSLVLWIIKLNEIGNTRTRPGYSYYLVLIGTLLSFIISYNIHRSS